MIKVILKIDGMMCGMCEAHINDCIRRNFNVRKVRTSRKSGECSIVLDTAPDAERLKAVIAQTGYTVLSVTQTLCG